MTFDTALAELAQAKADLPDVIRALLAMATFAGLLGNEEGRNKAVEIAAELMSSHSRSLPSRRRQPRRSRR